MQILYSNNVGEITTRDRVQKLKEKKKGGGKSVSVSEFEAFGLVLVDEGHRGASGDVMRELRKLVGKNALTLEYSATFGQTVNGATALKKPVLLREYAAAILFDFSYPHFYADGYGKDYAILNSDDASDSGEWVLLSNVVSFYEQRLAYAADPESLRDYNIEAPLWILVGNSVTGGKATPDEQETLSDVQTVVGFFARFLRDRDGMTEKLTQLLAGGHPLKDGNGRDLLAQRFAKVRASGRTGHDLWAHIVGTVFGAGGNETLVASELKNAKGEIGLRARARAIPTSALSTSATFRGYESGLKSRELPWRRTRSDPDFSTT